MWGLTPSVSIGKSAEVSPGERFIKLSWRGNDWASQAFDPRLVGRRGQTLMTVWLRADDLGKGSDPFRR